MSEERCLSCGTAMSVLDDDPNGAKNCTCSRCRAEEEHDFDRSPNVVFDRAGRMKKLPPMTLPPMPPQ